MLWKLYLGLMGFLVGGSLALLPIQGPHAIYPLADYLILPVSAAQVAGLYGYAFRRPLLSDRFWQLAFPVFVLNLLATLWIGGVRFAAAQDDIGVVAATVFVSLFGLPLFLPLLIANRWYAFRSPSLWQERSGDVSASRGGPHEISS
jgi:hypothetical protein